jgi:predicted Ser/Thr protein kinase
MARPSQREAFWRGILRDPEATREQKLQAAIKLEKFDRERKALRKEAAAEVTAQEQASPSDDPYSGGDWSFIERCNVRGCPNKTDVDHPYCEAHRGPGE